MKDQIPGAIPVITIRGVGLDDFSSTNNPAAGIYVDEVFLSSLALMSSDFYDLQRVEVLQRPTRHALRAQHHRRRHQCSDRERRDHFEHGSPAVTAITVASKAMRMLNLPLGPNAAFRIAAHTIQQDEGYWRSRFVGNIGSARYLGSARAAGADLVPTGKSISRSKANGRARRWAKANFSAR